jgi:molybdenum cofactor cytidylyltransferase
VIGLERIAVILLAAGQSRRFGPLDKLEQPLLGKPLGLHVADTLAVMPFGWKFAVCPAGGGRLAEELVKRGFRPVPNAEPARGRGYSLALGAKAAVGMGADAVMVCLADMPFVSPQHLAALAARFETDIGQAVASTDGSAAKPPAIFASRHLSELGELDGDSGARHLLANAALVVANPAELADLDVPEDFQRYTV